MDPRETAASESSAAVEVLPEPPEPSSVEAPRQGVRRKESGARRRGEGETTVSWTGARGARRDPCLFKQRGCALKGRGPPPLGLGLKTGFLGSQDMEDARVWSPRFPPRGPRGARGGVSPEPPDLHVGRPSGTAGRDAGGRTPEHAPQSWEADLTLTHPFPRLTTDTETPSTSCFVFSTNLVFAVRPVGCL